MENENAYVPTGMKNLVHQNKYYISLIIELMANNFIIDELFRELFKKVSLLTHTSHMKKANGYSIYKGWA